MPPIPKESSRVANEIARSGYIVGSWYATAYPDVAATGLKASEHYASIGARMGRDPGAFFDTRFYEETSGDLMMPGENPLMHYVRHGRAAGRPGRAWGQATEVRRLARHLWGALPGPAAEALRAVAESPVHDQAARFEALVELAGRLDFDGRPEEAAATLERIAERAPRWAGAKGALVRRGVLAARMGDAALARECLEATPPVAGPGGEPEPDPDAALALAGLEEEDEARLAATSAVLVRRGLEPLRRRDPSRPLSLRDLEAAPAPCGLPHLGRVSVIVPAHRAEGTLDAALRSLLAQSYPDLEILVVDDASPDATFAVAEAAARRDLRVRAIRMARNGGAYAARNLGLAQATGAFVTTHDADDWSHPRKIEAQLRAFLRDPGMMGNASHWARVRADLRPTTNWRLTDAIVHPNHSSLMLRREAADRLGPWDEVRTGADSEYIWRLQATFGREAYARVEPGVPLAFGLDEEGSLTRAAATHLVGNYHGARLLYREVSRHHLRTARDPCDPAGRAAKMRRVPGAMRMPPRPAPPLDLCLRGDLFAPEVVERMVAILASPDRARACVGLLHEPALESQAVRFAPALWGALDGERVILLTEEPAAATRTVRVSSAPSPEAPVTPAENPGMDDSAPAGRPTANAPEEPRWIDEEDER